MRREKASGAEPAVARLLGQSWGVCRRRVPLDEMVSSREKEVSFFELQADEHSQGFLGCATNGGHFKGDESLVCPLAI